MPEPGIPRSIHQLWFGPADLPQVWTRTWREAHPDWSYRLWREGDVEAFGLRNHRLWRSLVERGVYDAASDVARIEILHRLGGVYIDADSRCLKPLHDAPFMAAAFFATAEIRPDGSRFVTNAFMGSVPGSRVAERYVERIARRPVRCAHGGEGAAFCCAWKTTGPMVLTAVLRGTDAVILEPSAFFTQTITGEPITGEHWGEHYWASTGARSPAGTFPAARTYEEAG